MRSLRSASSAADAEGVHALGDRVAHAHARIERGHRILEHDLDPAPRRGAARPARASADRCPRRRTRPARGWTRRRIERPTVVLPQPDSPTSASVRPASTREIDAVDRAHPCARALQRSRRGSGTRSASPRPRAAAASRVDHASVPATTAWQRTAADAPSTRALGLAHAARLDHQRAAIGAKRQPGGQASGAGTAPGISASRSPGCTRPGIARSSPCV